MNLYLKLFNKNIVYLYVILSSFICLSLPHLAPASVKDNKSNSSQTAEKPQDKTYHIQFFSLKRGHSIAPATIILHDKGKLEINIEREEIITTKCDYSIDNFTFEANWEFTIKNNKQYMYAANFKGLYFPDSYLLGIFMLKEFIDPKILAQEIPFLFWGAFASEEQPKKDKKK
jgi:hypothetical protein